MNGIIQRKRNLVMLCLLWGALLAALAVQPEKVVEIFLPSVGARNMAHVGAYGTLAFLVCLFGKFKRHLFGFPLTQKNLIAVTFLAVTCLGGFTEYLQSFTPDRTPDLLDVFFDMIGAGGGILSFYLFRGAL